MLSDSPVLKIRDFRLLFTNRLLITISLQIQAVIVGWQVYQLKQDALLLGLIGLVEAIPAIGCAFFSGHLVDIHRPAGIYRLSILALLANAFILWFAAIPQIPIAADTRLALIFFAVFVSGAARSFATPAVFSLIPQIVPRPLLSAAAAWNSSSFQLAAIIGPAIGGLAYGILGPTITFLLPALFVLIAWLLSETLSSTTKALKSQYTREPFLKSLSSGIHFTLTHRVLLSAMTLDMFSVLFGSAVAVLPVFADQVLKTGPYGLGVLRAAPSVGSGIVALFLALRPMHVISGKVLLFVVAGFGLSKLLFAVSTHFWLSVFFLAVSGAFDGISMVIRSTILQLLTPERMRGRVSALSSVFITSSNEIGAFESGVAARLLGLVPSVIFGGTMTLAIVLITNWVSPELRKTRITHEQTETG